jgi:hypothetical protein
MITEKPWLVLGLSLPMLDWDYLCLWSAEACDSDVSYGLLPEQILGLVKKSNLH